MFPRKLRLPSIVFTAVVLASSLAWALGVQLGETKEQLKLDYAVTATDHGTGRVTIHLTLADEGRLKPLDSVDLVVPSQDGTGYVDLSLSLAPRKVDGKQEVSVHLKRELAERAELRLKTHSLDGKPSARTWYYYSIPLADSLKDIEPKKK